jgi:hypothetical protein
MRSMSDSFWQTNNSFLNRDYSHKNYKMDNKPTPQPTEQVTETTELAADDVAAQSTETAEPKKKKKRSEIKSGPTAVIEFLNRCTRFQADAVRVIVSSIDEDGNTKDISPDDTDAVNTYLNHGATTLTVKTEADMAKHRGKQLQALLKLLTDFFSKDNYCTAVVVLTGISSDATHLKTAFNDLQKK